MVEISYASTVGKRAVNQDNLLIPGGKRPRIIVRDFHRHKVLKKKNALGIYAVADGMGGTSCGELASLRCVKELKRTAEMEREIAHQRIADAVNRLGEAGTTLSYVRLRQDGESYIAYINTIGDTDFYVISADGEITFRSYHDTCRQFYLDFIASNEENGETMDNYPKNALKSFLGRGKQPDFHSQKLILEQGDTIIIASDGCCLDSYSEPQLASLLTDTEPALKLVSHGSITSKDNATAIILKIVGKPRV